jgi:hypothetical protein
MSTCIFQWHKIEWRTKELRKELDELVSKLFLVSVKDIDNQQSSNWAVRFLLMLLNIMIQIRIHVLYCCKRLNIFK